MDAVGVRQRRRHAERLSEKQPGLGTTLVKALAKQLEAQVETTSSGKGTVVSITRAPSGPVAKDSGKRMNF